MTCFTKIIMKRYSRHSRLFFHIYHGFSLSIQNIGFKGFHKRRCHESNKKRNACVIQQNGRNAHTDQSRKNEFGASIIGLYPERPSA